ncbi:MAG: efflux RND transporter periplasmic adaptor subunit [bacterium]|nr:efflux RND transporter periplasmic adaptor subunit [bacterium]
MSKQANDTSQDHDALSLPPMSRRMAAFSMALFFLLGVGLTWLVFGDPLGLNLTGARTEERSAPRESDTVELEKVYQCPMHPEVIDSKPSDCPICGMPLEEVRETPNGGEAVTEEDADVVRIDPVQIQNTGVVSVEADVEDIARLSRTVGILDFNADSVTWINTKYEGWLETVHVNYVGQEVRAGQPLFEIYSPELVTTQEEFLRALEYRDSLTDAGRPETLRQADSLVRAARERLGYWDIAAGQIERLESAREVQRRLTVSSPVDGVVAELMSEALEGMFVKPGMDLYKIVDLSTVWVHADVYESDMPWIREGQPAVVSFRNEAQREFRGKVLFLYPEVSKQTRTLKICVEVPNPDGRLRPGMYADVQVHGPAIEDAVVIPESAVIRSGERDIVFLDLGEGRFRPREVAVGIRGDGNRVQVLDGLAAGDAVVTQALFMLDSESRMQEAIAKFRQRGTARDSQPATEHRH